MLNTIDWDFFDDLEGEENLDPDPPRPEADIFGAPEADAGSYLINYNEKFKDSQPTLFRENLIRQTLSCLIGVFKPNALLIGAAGVGKTKIVEDIARRIASGDPRIPAQLKDYTIYELPLSNILSGSGLVGDLERKTNAVIEFAKNPENKAILFIDEIHMLLDGNQSYEKIAQIMKPALARGDMKVIGATTLQEAQTLMSDPAFNRRFTRLMVDELTQAQTKDILRLLRPVMFEHYGRSISITDKVIDEIVAVADNYRTAGSHRPDNAITLLDRSMADACIDRGAKPPSSVTSLSEKQMKSTAMKLITGNSERADICADSLRKALEPIKGQDKVIDYLLDAIERDSLNIYPRTKPVTWLFAGSSGTGKSETADIIAKELTGNKPIVLNMTEYSNASAINRITGSPNGYAGCDSKAELPFDILESNPYQVIILDEFEKSDRSVQRLFMSAFDEGYIRTAKGKTVDFSRSVIIATTNAGYSARSGHIGFIPSSGSSAGTISDLSEFFDTELLNRFMKILRFENITEALFADILRDTYKRQAAAVISANKSYRFLPAVMPEADVQALVKANYTPVFGARPVKRLVRKYIEDAVLLNIKSRSAYRGSRVRSCG